MSLKQRLAAYEHLDIRPASRLKIVEFWNVSTRPTNRRGFGRTPQQTGIHVNYLESIFLLLPEDQRIYPAWRSIVLEHSVSGKQVHDTRLAATLRVHQISMLLTEDISDFKRFHWLEAITPEAFLAQSS